MDYVFDSSFVAAQIIPDEKNPQVDKLCASIGEDETIFVPQLLWYEMANILKNLFRTKRYTFEEVLYFIPALKAICLINDYEPGADYSERLLRLAHDYYLSSYDAAYLELADRKKAVLCTLNENLQGAAEIHGVKIMKTEMYVQG
jgi:predicted nucleic acid-binding protein